MSSLLGYVTTQLCDASIYINLPVAINIRSIYEGLSDCLVDHLKIRAHFKHRIIHLYQRQHRGTTNTSSAYIFLHFLRVAYINILHSSRHACFPSFSYMRTGIFSSEVEHVP